jgi:hypothetical protein
MVVAGRAMTYNFDPEKWLEAQRAVLEARRARGELDASEMEAEIRELERRYDELVARLDGTFEISSRSRGE